MGGVWRVQGRSIEGSTRSVNHIKHQITCMCIPSSVFTISKLPL
jgi:hypothetical protein